MRIPTWQIWIRWRKFFSGMAIGGLISWCIFVFIFGVLQEKQTTLISKQKDDIEDLKDEKIIWQEKFKELNKKNQETMTIQKINVKIKNAKTYKLDPLSVFEVEESVKQDLSMMVAKDIETVFISRDLINKVIENKIVKINGKRYSLEVKEVYIYTTLNIQLDIHLEK